MNPFPRQKCKVVEAIHRSSTSIGSFLDGKVEGAQLLGFQGSKNGLAME